MSLDALRRSLIAAEANLAAIEARQSQWGTPRELVARAAVERCRSKLAKAENEAIDRVLSNRPGTGAILVDVKPVPPRAGGQVILRRIK